MKKFYKLLSLLFVSIMVFTIASFFGKADASTYDINSTTLYNATNTYNYSFSSSQVNKINEENNFLIPSVSGRYQERYSMYSRNFNGMFDIKPQITVFTHGWNGKASTWDNKFDGSYIDYNSLVQQMYDRNSNSSVYLAKFKSPTEFGLFDITSCYSNRMAVPNFSDNSSEYNNPFNAIKNNVHNIIVFEGYNTGYSNDYIYNQFNYMLSCVVLQVKQLNGGLLPKINLIGHSRGGLTNMQYALDHPDLVNQMYSYDTPYMGTTSGSLLKYAITLAGQGIGIASGFLTGLQDLTNQTAYLTLMNRWNNNYYRYSHINVQTFAGVTTIYDSADKASTRLLDILKMSERFTSFDNEISTNFSFGRDVILDAVCDKILEVFVDALCSLTVAAGYVLLNSIAPLTATLAVIIIELIRPILIPIIEANMIADNGWNVFNPILPILADLKINEIRDSIISFFTDMSLHLLTEFKVCAKNDGSYKIVWNNDVCVDLNSQLAMHDGIGYNGFKGQLNNVEEYYLLDSGITHIAATHNPSLHQKVLSSIVINNKRFDINSLNKILFSNAYNYYYQTSLTINGSEMNYYVLDMKTTGNFTIETLGNVSTNIYLYDYRMNLLSSSVNGNTNAKMSYMLYSSNKYYIGIKGRYSSSSYGTSTLKITKNVEDLSGANTMVELDGTFINRYKFIPNESGTYTFETSGSKDTYMYLYDSNMNQISYNDDGGNGLNSQIQYNLVNGNTYYIGLRAYGSSTNGYTQLTYTTPVHDIYSGNNFVSNNARYTYTATEKVLVSIETTDDIDTKFTNIVSSNSDYSYYDDTYIDDNDGGEYIYDASLYVVLEAGQSISFTVSSNYVNPNSVHIKISEDFLDRKPVVTTPRIYEGDNVVDKNKDYTFVAQRNGIYVFETTDDIDTFFRNIVSDNSDYDYEDDTYIDDNDGGEYIYDACLYVYLRSGETISFAASTNYSNYSSLHLTVRCF